MKVISELKTSILHGNSQDAISKLSQVEEMIGDLREFIAGTIDIFDAISKNDAAYESLQDRKRLWDEIKEP